MTFELQFSTLAPLVAQAINKPDLEILDWRVTPLTGGASTVTGLSTGVSRVSGTAQDHSVVFPWSLICKAVAPGTPETCDPTCWNYWQREALAYQSGLLDDLPGSVSAPRCYAVQQQEDDLVWIWLEDIQASPSAWTMTDYGLTAQHFGHFNGAYLAGYPMPKPDPWLSRGRVRPWNAIVRSWLQRLERMAQPAALRRILPGNTLERLRQLAEYEPMLAAFERLPISFCHLDAFRRNLFLRRTSAGAHETVAIDWAYVGLGRLGEEAGASVAGPLMLTDIPISQARELDQTVFAGYLDGLQEAGWNGDVRQVRLGYVVNALVLLMRSCVGAMIVQPSPEMIALTRELTKLSWDEFIEYRAETVPFFLDLGDEAVALAEIM